MFKILLAFLTLLTISLPASADKVNSAGTAFSGGSSFTTPLNTTAVAGYEQYGVTILTTKGGPNGESPPYPVCTFNCSTLVGAHAGEMIPTADWLTTAVGNYALGKETANKSESTAMGWNAGGNLTGDGPVAGVGHFVSLFGVNTLGTCTTSCDHVVTLGNDTFGTSSAVTESVAVGTGAGFLANVDQSNAVGTASMRLNLSTTGVTRLDALGHAALFGANATTIHDLVAIGKSALFDPTTANQGVAIGDFALTGPLTTDADFVYLGYKAGFNAVGSLRTTAVGSFVIGSGVYSGFDNQAFGYQAGYRMTTTHGVNILGKQGCQFLTTGINNLCIGNNVGATLVTGAGNILIGNGCDVATSSTGNTICVQNIITATAIATPTTSVTTIAGNFDVVGGQLGAIGIKTADYTLTAQDYFVGMNKASGAATAISIPACGTGANVGQHYFVKDSKGDAAANPITITPAAGTIDGAATDVINVARGSVEYICGNSSWQKVANYNKPGNPVVASGFMTASSPSTGYNAFEITVGVGAPASSGVLTMPTAANWACDFNTLAVDATITKVTARTTTSVTVTHISTVTGIAANWTAGEVITGRCTPY